MLPTCCPCGVESMRCAEMDWAHVLEDLDLVAVARDDTQAAHSCSQATVNDMQPS